MPAPITTKNFTAKLASWKTQAGSMRGNAQSILTFGMDHYQAHGDAGYLSRMYAAACTVKGINADKMRDWIRAHANVKLGRDKLGQPAFSKVTKKAAPETTPTAERGLWWEYGKSPNPSPKTVDVGKRIESIAAAIDSALEKGELVNAAEYAAAIRKLEAALKKARLAQPIEQAA